jgi:hypothetical protein
MDLMKYLALLLSLPVALCAVDLPAVRSVYLMPMSRGLDQYLANRLTNEHVFQVVTDARLADAVFTDRLGESFELLLENLLPPPKPEPPPPPAKDAKVEDSKIPLLSENVNRLENPALNSSFGRGKGTVFLVDVKSKQVIWSTFEPPAGSMGKEMDRTAGDIVGRLMKDIGLKKK